jgi:hypothetical protein
MRAVRARNIAAAARQLDDLRNAWLNPDDLIEIVQESVPGYPPRILPKNEAVSTELKMRTLTNLYNEQPQWLINTHRELDSAVAEAYGWSSNISDEDVLANLVELNQARTGSEEAT